MFKIVNAIQVNSYGHLFSANPWQPSVLSRGRWQNTEYTLGTSCTYVYMYICFITSELSPLFWGTPKSAVTYVFPFFQIFLLSGPSHMQQHGLHLLYMILFIKAAVLISCVYSQNCWSAGWRQLSVGSQQPTDSCKLSSPPSKLSSPGVTRMTIVIECLNKGLWIQFLK